MGDQRRHNGPTTADRLESFWHSDLCGTLICVGSVLSIVACIWFGV